MRMPFIVVSSSQNRTFLQAQENQIIVYMALKALFKIEDKFRARQNLDPQPNECDGQR